MPIRHAPNARHLSGLAAGVILAIAGCNLQLEPAPRGAVEKLAPAGRPMPQSLVKDLEQAYETRDQARFEALLAEDFLFILDMPGPGGETQWGRTEEWRIHQRMFGPENIPPSEPPLPPEFWLQSLEATLTQQTKWTERPDLYASPANPEGPDPAVWFVCEAIYGTQVFFQMQGDTDYLVEGRAAFVVMVERVGLGTSQQLSYIYRWEDLGSDAAKQQPAAVEPVTWSNMKQLYR